MELVPILSTIILVGTIATFILAVAAYILYKIRERRAREEPATVQQSMPEPHVLVAPEEQRIAATSQQMRPASTNVYVGAPQERQQPATSVTVQQPQAQPSVENSLFWEYTDEGFVPVRPDDPTQHEEESEAEEDDGYAWL